MSSHSLEAPEVNSASEAHSDTADATEAARHPFLVSLGERVRGQRARRGMTRKALARAAAVSERHLANLERGEGNASILILLSVANALHCTLAELLGDATTTTPEWLLLRDLLSRADDATLERIRFTVADMLGGASPGARRSPRIALVGLRGAGKSTLGAMLAKELGRPFIDLSREVERVAGCSISEIQALYGQIAYRRHERRALEEAIQAHPAAVFATPGGIVSDPSNFNLLLQHCTTVWLQAQPEDHMRRVVAQGDTRPMSASREAMEDLKSILEERSPFYAKAEFSLDTSGQTLAETFDALLRLARDLTANAKP